MVRFTWRAFQTQHLKTASAVFTGTFAATAMAFVASSIYHSEIETRIQFTVGSKLKLSGLTYKGAELKTKNKIATPLVKAVLVRKPQIKVLIEPKAQEFVVTPNLLEPVVDVSGIAKQGLTIENVNTQQSLEYGLDQESLLQLLDGTWDKLEAQKKAVAIQKLDIQTQPLPPAVTQKISPKMVSEKFEQAPESKGLLALNDALKTEKSKLDYSQLTHLLSPPEPAVIPKSIEPRPQTVTLQAPTVKAPVPVAKAPVPEALIKPLDIQPVDNEVEESPVERLQYEEIAESEYPTANLTTMRPTLGRVDVPTQVVSQSAKEIEHEVLTTQDEVPTQIQKIETPQPKTPIDVRAYLPAPPVVVAPPIVKEVAAVKTTVAAPAVESSASVAAITAASEKTGLALLLPKSPAITVSRAPTSTVVQNDEAATPKTSVTPSEVEKPAPAEGTTGPQMLEQAITQLQASQSQRLADAAASTVVAARQVFSGRIHEAFTKGKSPVSQALVQILGTPWSTATDENGDFSFKDVKIEGVLPVVITKEGYLKRRVDLKMNLPLEVELVSENAAALSAVAAQESRLSQTSMIFGQLISPIGEAVEALRVEIIDPNQRNFEPIYIDKSGLPNRELKMTSSRGQFILLNVTPGTYLVNAVDAFGVERAPHLISVGENEGLVRRFSLGEPRTISGRVVNGASTNAVIDSAAVRILGSPKAAVTDKRGQFTLDSVYVDCFETNYIQFEKSGFYRNRLDYKCTDANSKPEYYVFSAAYIDGLSLESHSDLKPTSGAIMGHVSFTKSVKMQLWGPEEMDSTAGIPRGKEMYFDTDGVLNVDRKTTSRNGNFVMFDAPAGLSYMQAFGKDDRTLSFWPVYLSPSTLNVYMQ